MDEKEPKPRIFICDTNWYKKLKGKKEVGWDEPEGLMSVEEEQQEAHKNE